jgi:integrase
MTTPRTPKLRRHKATGQAVVTLNGHDHYLGVWPKTSRTAPAHVRQAYDRLIAEWLRNGRQSARPQMDTLTIAEAIARFWQHVETHYRRPDGTPTNEVNDYRLTLRPLNHLYADTPAGDFGPLALEAVRQLMTDGYTHPKYGPQERLSRNVINQRIERIRRMFKWLVSKQLVQPTVLTALQALTGLQRGRTEARETDPVLPVSRAVVEDTLPILRPMVADMVRLQLESGMRPGEMVSIRAIAIDMTGTVWLYKPDQHKTQHHGHQRIVPIGPKSQEIVKRYLTTNVEAPLFSPARNMEDKKAELRNARKTKVQPSQLDRGKKRPKRKPGHTYTTLTYGRSIANAIKRHNAGKPESEHIPHWHPHQLRHTRALEIKREAGLDVARAVLGHRSPCITEMYATLDVATAAQVMAKIG